MGRGKLTLDLISNEKSRKTTFLKRKKGIIKKAREFSILCGVDTCVIIYGTPAICDRPEEPEIWPPNPSEVERIIRRYENEGTDRRSKRIVGLPEFFLDKRRKIDREFVKARAAVWEAKYPVSEDLIAGLSQEQLRSLRAVLGQRLESAKKRLATLKEEEAAAAAATAMPLSDSVKITPLMNVDAVDLRHSFYMQGTAAWGHEARPIGVNQPLQPQCVPNMPPLRIPLPLELTQFGCTGLCSSVFHPSQAHHELVASSDGFVVPGFAPSDGLDEFVASIDSMNWPALSSSGYNSTNSFVDRAQLVPLGAQFPSGDNFHHRPHHDNSSLNHHQMQNYFRGDCHDQYSEVSGIPGVASFDGLDLVASTVSSNELALSGSNDCKSYSSYVDYVQSVLLDDEFPSGNDFFNHHPRCDSSSANHHQVQNCFEGPRHDQYTDVVGGLPRMVEEEQEPCGFRVSAVNLIEQEASANLGFCGPSWSGPYCAAPATEQVNPAEGQLVHQFQRGVADPSSLPMVQMMDADSLFDQYLDA